MKGIIEKAYCQLVQLGREKSYFKTRPAESSSTDNNLVAREISATLTVLDGLVEQCDGTPPSRVSKQIIGQSSSTGKLKM